MQPLLPPERIVSEEFDHYFVPFDAHALERADDEARIVEGYAYTTARVPGDKWNLKRQALERAAKAYMEMPCVRAMHGPIAAGHAQQVTFDDKGCRIRAYISDDNEWRKCKAGTYRGFSIGGKPRLVRGTDVEEFDWLETSLVDRPKDAGARFTLVRSEALAEPAPFLFLPAEATEAEVELARGALHLAPPQNDIPLERTLTSADVPANPPGDSDTPLGLDAAKSLAAIATRDLTAQREAALSRIETALNVSSLDPSVQDALFAARSALQDLAAPESDAPVTRAEWAGELRRLEHENALLRATPLQRAAPVIFPALAGNAMALERAFTANTLLDPTAPEREALLARRDATREALQSETDELKRAALLRDWMRLDEHLKTT